MIRFKVIYLCSKENLCLVSEDTFLQKTDYDEVYEKVVNKIEFVKLKVIDEKVQVAFQSFKRNCTKMVLNNNSPFKLFSIKDINLASFRETLLKYKNINFDRNENDECCYTVSQDIKDEDKKDIDDFLVKYTSFLRYDSIRCNFFSTTNSYGFEPVVFYCEVDMEKYTFAIEDKNLFEKIS